MCRFINNVNKTIDEKITDSISIIDSDTIHIDREFSDHDGTYVTIGCGFSNNKNYKRIHIGGQRLSKCCRCIENVEQQFKCAIKNDNEIKLQLLFYNG
jgi:hypothetical protein